MDAIGQDGLQLFIDAGRPVDPDLVNALVREVLMEKLTTMIGQKPEDEGQSTEVAANLVDDNSEVMSKHVCFLQFLWAHKMFDKQ